MPMASKPYEMGGNRGNGRRSFRTFSDDRRPKGNGNGHGHSSARPIKTPPPPEATNAESFYYVKQMSSKTPMVVVMSDGEEIRGCIEWYDRNCIKVNREGAPNLLIQKLYIKYLFKADERV